MIAALLVAASLVGQHPYRGAVLPDTFHLTDSVASPSPLAMSWDATTGSWLSPGNTYQLRDGDGLRVLGYGGESMWFDPAPGSGLPIMFIGDLPVAGPIMVYYAWPFIPITPAPRPLITLTP